MLISKGMWTSDDPITGDIFTVLSSYGIRYNELSNNLTHSITNITGKNKSDAFKIEKHGNNTIWNFNKDGGLRVATNGPVSSVNSNDANEWTAAVNFETCRALSSDAWWQVHRTCFDAARAREMSGVVNRMLMEKGEEGRLAANKFGMIAIVYDILNRHWMASDYFKCTDVLTCVHEIDKEKRSVTIKNAAQAGIRSSLYDLCEFRCWSTQPFVYYNENTTPMAAFAIGNKKSLNEFADSCFTYDGKPISYSLIDTLDELADTKMNIDMSIYDQNRFSSLSATDAGYAGPVSHTNATINGRTYSDIPYRTLKTAFPLPSDITSSTKLANLPNNKKANEFGPSYMGNIYLYPVYAPYKLPLWDYWKDNTSNNFVYQSEPNPCGSKTVYTKIMSTFGNDILFNPQQALWEYCRYFVMKLKNEGLTQTDAENNALPGDMIHFFEKFCRIQIYFKAKSEIPSGTSINIKFDKPPRYYMLSPSRRGEKSTTTITYDNNAVDNLTMRSNQIVVAGNEPTLFQFSHGEGTSDVEWLIWIDAMWVW